MAETLLDARSIGHAYDPDTVILDQINFSLEPGETVGIQGQSGVGKTTLLEILGTMREPTDGEVRYGEQSVYELSLEDRAELRGRYLGFVFQEGLLLPDLTLWENCRLAVELSARSWSVSKIEDQFERLLSQLGLDPDRREDQPAQLSTGERQRLAVARALMHDPNLIIADEPTGNLDPESSKKLLELMLPFAERDRTAILIASHDRDLTESLSTVLTLDDGTLR
jgi:lipoprotein-releasing system ATP-binding protein